MSDVHALSGAYALDALDDIERAGFERHLAICETCREEVASLQEAAAVLSEAYEMTPPAVLRERVMAEIATFRPLPPLVEHTEADAVAPVVPLGRRRFLTMAAAAAVVAAVGVGAVAVTDDRTTPVPESGAARVLAADDAVSRTLTTDGGAKVTITRSRELNQAVLRVEGMTPLPSGKVYELWFQHGDHMVAAGFLPNGSDNTVLLTGDASTATAVGITTEPEGGSRSPNLATAVVIPFDGV